MPAYVVANIEVTNPDAYRQYVAEVPETIAAHGGRYLARGGDVEILEGDWRPSRLVIVEFATVDQARAWYRSADYGAIRDFRVLNSNSQLVLTDGLGG